MSFLDNLNLYIRARYPMLYIQTYEEERILQDIIQISLEIKPPRNIEIWDIINGFDKGTNTKGNPLAALDYIAKSPKESICIYILKDFHRFLNDIQVSRAVRNLATQLKRERKTVIITSPILQIPVELQEDITVLDYNLPDYQQIDENIKKLTSSVKLDLSPGNRETLIKACQGLTLNRIREILSKAIAQYSRISEEVIDLVLEEKKQIIRRTEILEFYPTIENLNDIGGLDELKQWIKLRGLAFTDKAIEYGIPYPKGVMLLGIQGTGKSLCSKVIAKQWKMPLLKLDIGRLMGSLVGESEARTRQMIKTAEAMAPSILWIDEIDKAFAGQSGVQGDSGTSSRVLGTILTWMQEKTSPVFIAATANNIQHLPPELLRKGRFDEIFFVDLPDQRERKEIFQVHLQRKRGVYIRSYNIESLASATEGFSGAEVEQVITDAMFYAFSQEREFTTDDILSSITKTVPLSQTAKENIDCLREWANNGRARRASSEIRGEPTKAFISEIEVDLPQ